MRAIALLLCLVATSANAWTATKVSPAFGTLPDGILIHVGDTTYVKANGSPCYRLSTGSEGLMAFNALDEVQTGRRLTYVAGTEQAPTTFASLVTYDDSFRLASSGDVYVKHTPTAAINLVTLAEHTFTGTETVIPVDVAITIRR